VSGDRSLGLAASVPPQGLAPNARSPRQELLSEVEAVWYPTRDSGGRGPFAGPGRSGRWKAPFASPALRVSLSPPAAWQRLTHRRSCQTTAEQKMRKRKKTEPEVEPEELLAAIAEAVGDGFCPASSLVPRFPKLSHRDLVRLRGRAARRGLLLERRGPDGQVYLALTSEGWRALRSSRTFSPSMNQIRRPSG
jgi:hypothetical protein